MQKPKDQQPSDQQPTIPPASTPASGGEPTPPEGDYSTFMEFEEVEIPTPTHLPVTFTGDKEYEAPKEIADPANQAFSLRQKLPLTQEKFSIDYDYAEGKFIVTIQDPFETNFQVFKDWLVQNGYEAIPESEFITIPAN